MEEAGINSKVVEQGTKLAERIRAWSVSGRREPNNILGRRAPLRLEEQPPERNPLPGFSDLPVVEWNADDRAAAFKALEEIFDWDEAIASFIEIAQARRLYMYYIIYIKVYVPLWSTQDFNRNAPGDPYEAYDNPSVITAFRRVSQASAVMCHDEPPESVYEWATHVWWKLTTRSKGVTPGKMVKKGRFVADLFDAINGTLLTV